MSGCFGNMINQSFSWWCFEKRGVEPVALLAGAAKIGYTGVDLIEEALWPMVEGFGLSISAVNGHKSIEDGLNRRENAERIENELRGSIAKARQWKIPVLICFSGNRAGMSDDAGLQQCAETLGRVAGVAADACPATEATRLGAVAGIWAIPLFDRAMVEAC